MPCKPGGPGEPFIPGGPWSPGVPLCPGDPGIPGLPMCSAILLVSLLLELSLSSIAGQLGTFEAAKKQTWDKSLSLR